ncbi:hypothetical protein FPV67DRAFT_1452531 [Lyophyllum atratum]|nr:hypothetical protein FPV67DRAFT_1452531 [Lyophyllum atratum]
MAKTMMFVMDVLDENGCEESEEGRQMESSGNRFDIEWNQQRFRGRAGIKDGHEVMKKDARGVEAWAWSLWAGGIGWEVDREQEDETWERIQDGISAQGFPPPTRTRGGDVATRPGGPRELREIGNVPYIEMIWCGVECRQSTGAGQTDAGGGAGSGKAWSGVWGRVCSLIWVSESTGVRREVSGMLRGRELNGGHEARRRELDRGAWWDLGLVRWRERDITVNRAGQTYVWKFMGHGDCGSGVGTQDTRGWARDGGIK